MRETALLFLRRYSAPADGGFRSRTNGALDGDVEQRGLAAGQCSLERRPKIVRLLDELAVAAEALDDWLVTSLEQVGGHRAAIQTQLNLPVDAPGRIVADERDDIEVVAHSGAEF